MPFRSCSFLKVYLFTYFGTLIKLYWVVSPLVTTYCFEYSDMNIINFYSLLSIHFYFYIWNITGMSFSIALNHNSNYHPLAHIHTFGYAISKLKQCADCSNDCYSNGSDQCYPLLNELIMNLYMYYKINLNWIIFFIHGSQKRESLFLWGFKLEINSCVYCVCFFFVGE